MLPTLEAIGSAVDYMDKTWSLSQEMKHKPECFPLDPMLSPYISKEIKSKLVVLIPIKFGSGYIAVVNGTNLTAWTMCSLSSINPLIFLNQIPGSSKNRGSRL